MPRRPAAPELDLGFWTTFGGWLVASLDGRYALTARGRRELLPRLQAQGLRLADYPSLDKLQHAFVKLQRAEAAARAPEALHQALADPLLSAENRAFLRKAMALQTAQQPAARGQERALRLAFVSDKEKAS